jgi:transcriptional regulator with XRE-family HTH domain
MSELFGEKLRHVRHQQRITQGELAEKVGLSSTYVHRLEVNLRTPSLDIVVRIAAYFSQSTDYFLRDTIAVEAPATTAPTVLAKTTELPRLFGGRLRMLRLQHGWSQTDLARRLDLKRRGYISNLEAGRKTPSLDLIVQIADLFGVTADYLLSRHEVEDDTEAGLE